MVRMKEGAPRAFSRLVVGDTARWCHTVTAEEVDRFAHLSGDVNDLHLDDRFARRHGFRGRVVHGMLINAFLSRVLGTMLPGPGVLWLSQTTRFMQTVYVDDTIEVVVQIKHKSETLRTLVLETSVYNQQGAAILTGEAKVMMLAQEQWVPWSELVAIVTGASRGIGAATARALGAKGARVVVNYHQRREPAEEVVAAIEAAGGQAQAVQADVSTVGGAQALAEAALDRFGRVDVVVNNATPPIAVKPLMEMTWEEVDRYWQTYVQSAFTMNRLVAPGMKERGFGRFVHILTARMWGNPPEGQAGYIAAKSGLWGLAKAAAVELAPYGITVNAVSPSAVLTDQWEGIPESRLRAMALRIPLRRLATPEDVARAVMFFLSEEGGYITGTNLPVAGGEVM